MEMLDEVKVLRDPIHGYIRIGVKVIWNAVNSKEFQRLRRIKQLGGAYQVYHTAEHTRFAHSLGVYEIVRRMCEEVEDINKALSEKEKVVVMLAGLLHDLGHAPFSHAFEGISNVKHELLTLDIIRRDTMVHRCLVNSDPSLVEEVALVIEKKHPNNILNQIISSQLDADRMDYLLRDAYFTGTNYGVFDLARVLRTMRVYQNKLVIKESGIHGVEDYIMARYHMYWQVYYHPTSRAFEVMLSALFRRLKDVYATNPDILKEVKMFHPYLKGIDISVDVHYEFDEAACLYGFMLLTKVDDKILNDLASRLLERKIFKYVDLIDEATYKQKQDKLLALNYDPHYYLDRDRALQKPYNPYSLDAGDGIWILMTNNETREISEASVIVKALVQGEVKSDSKMYFPEECR